MKYTLKRKYEAICEWFNPRQKWLTKEIPNSWCDKVELIPRLLFACLIDFVEKEEGLKMMDYDWAEELEAGRVHTDYIDDCNKRNRELYIAYDYIKNQRHLLDKALGDSYPDYGLKGTYEELYSKTNALEKEIKDKDIDAMQVIIRNHEYLWT
jgi:hypothetical protein